MLPILTEMETLQQLVESSNPKEIFMKVLKNKGDYDKRRLLNILKVDVKKAEPVYIHKHYKLKRKENTDNIFIYVDKRYKIMGITKGNRWDKKYSSVEDYDAAANKNYVSGWSIVKNQKSLSESAYHILMFKSDDILDVNINCIDNVQYRGKNALEIERDKKYRDLLSSLSNRVFQYKVNKYKDITTENLMSMIGEMLVVCSRQLIREDEGYSITLQKIYRQIKKKTYYVSEINKENIIKYVYELIGALQENQKEVDRGYNREYSLRKYNEHKLSIIGYYKDFFGEVA